MRQSPERITLLCHFDLCCHPQTDKTRAQTKPTQGSATSGPVGCQHLPLAQVGAIFEFVYALVETLILLQLGFLQ